MKVFVGILALVAAASAGVIPATTLVRTPSLDSAIIQSDRLGGNFAYSSVEGHAYAAVSPVVQNVVSPVGISYSATPYAHPINLVHQQLIAPHQYIAAPQVLAPQLIAGPQLINPAQFIGTPQIIGSQIIGAPQIISPVAPGIIAPSVPISPSENLVPVAAEVPQEGEQPAEVAEAAPAPEASPIEAPEEVPQSDDVVAVESA